MEASNVKAMRDALVWLRKTGHRSPEGGWMCITLKMTQKDRLPYPIEVPPYAEDVINAALSSPPRNCDVGTAEEQFERWQSFCDKFDDDCKGCPCDGHSSSLTHCFSKWAQLPCEDEVRKEGAGDEK